MQAAQEQLGESVSVYLDGGPCTEGVPSTILDLTGVIPKVLRAGAISVDRLRMVASVIADDEHYAEGPAATADIGEGPGAAADVKPAAPHPLDRPAPEDS
jgi:hypothetical protein